MEQAKIANLCRNRRDHDERLCLVARFHL